jgi:hypothetical protein
MCWIAFTCTVLSTLQFSNKYDAEPVCSTNTSICFNTSSRRYYLKVASQIEHRQHLASVGDASINAAIPECKKDTECQTRKTWCLMHLIEDSEDKLVICSRNTRNVLPWKVNMKRQVKFNPARTTPKQPTCLQKSASVLFWRSFLACDTPKRLLDTDSSTRFYHGTTIYFQLWGSS